MILHVMAVFVPREAYVAGDEWWIGFDMSHCTTKREKSQGLSLVLFKIKCSKKK
jgi:hypothetical protein